MKSTINAPEHHGSDQPAADASLPPHARLLLLLAESAPDTACRARARALMTQDDLDWGAFLHEAGRHRLLPLLGRHVDRFGWERAGADGAAIPEPWLFTNSLVGNRIRNQTLSDEFGRVLRELATDGVPHAVRRGFALVNSVYHDIGIRLIGDLDLFLNPADIPRAQRVLERLGYTREAPPGPQVPANSGESGESGEQSGPSAEHLQMTFLKPGVRPSTAEFHIDVYHQVFEERTGLSLPATTLLSRLDPAFVCGTETSVLGRADGLLDLCALLHEKATAPRRTGAPLALPLSKFLDAALVAESFTADAWQEFTDRVREVGAGHIAHHALHFTSVLYPSAVPAEVLRTLRPDDLDHLEEYTSIEGRQRRWTVAFPARLFIPDSGPHSGDAAP
ncbi:nucleotidyltransferase family protein [Streptomyces sp. NPDC096198]|uniref:nucleotidyltransferase family protein n=1 Tax=Streptomyces sp. NPDC096198 TaxID=3366080 RepID=UPI00380A08EC